MRTTARMHAPTIAPVLLLIVGLLVATAPNVSPQPIPGPFVQIHMNADFTITEAVNGGPFEPGSLVALVVEFADNSPDFVASEIADAQGGAVFCTGPCPFSLGEGDVVTLTDDSVPPQVATLTMPFFTLAEINLNADLVRGTGRAGDLVTVLIDPFPTAEVTVPVDESGAWTADFTGVYDLRADSCGGVQEPRGNGVVRISWCVADLVIEVGIDIEAGSDTNPVNLRSNGIIPVAILTTEDFDATTVAPMSVAFGPAGASEAHGRGHFSDIDHDGDIDLMLHFRTQETGVQPTDTEACLTARTLDGQAIAGCDLIAVRGDHK